MIGNPAADRGAGARISAKVLSMLRQEGARHHFSVRDLTGRSYDESLHNARRQRDDLSAIVVVGGDGMVSLGVNAVDGFPVALGIVAVGSGNDFARGLGLPVGHPEASVRGIVEGLISHTSLDVDTGLVTFPDSRRPPSERYFAGMLSCGIDASINDRANHLRLHNGSLRYIVAVITELTHIQQYGYHIAYEMPDGRQEEHDIATPMLTVANSRHIGGGLEISPYSRSNDGLLDVIWVDHMPSPLECVQALWRVYHGTLLGSRLFAWRRVRRITITPAPIGAQPPVLMMDGEYAGRVPVRVEAVHRRLQLLAPPAVMRRVGRESEAELRRRIIQDGRDPDTGLFR